MSNDPRHLSTTRRAPRDSTRQSERIEASLEALGLISNKKSHKPKRKAVDFNTSASASSSGYYRPSSRASTLLSEKSTSRTGTTSTRSGRGMAGILDIDRSNTRKERTFIGSECAVCEEPLEYTLRGERILQLTCSHVAHETCFYEYIREFDSQYCPTCNAPLGLDSSRGGNVLDFGRLKSAGGTNYGLTGTAEKLSRAAKNDQLAERQDYARSVASTPAGWESRIPDPPASIREQPLRVQRSQELLGPRARATTPGSERTTTILHARNDSNTTAGDFADANNGYTRRHDYDLQSMEASLSSPPALTKNPIPPPTVTVRSEFPTITRSRQQQSLTCLVTVEVTEGTWRPTMDDIRPPLPPPKGVSGDFSSVRSPQSHHRRNASLYETRQHLEEVTEELHSRVDNWHGLDFSRFGKLRLHGHVRVGKDRRAWQDLDCYLFSEMLICVKERKPAGHDYDRLSDAKKQKCTLKGSILIKKHLKDVETFTDENILTLSLSVAELPSFHLQFQNRDQLELWKSALLDINNPNPPMTLRSADYDLENSGTDDEDYDRKLRLSSAVSSYGAGKSYNTAATEYSLRTEPFDVRLPGRSLHVPLDIVVVIPVSSSMQGLKISLLRDSLRFLVMNLGERDRMGLVTFGSSGGGVPLVGMTSRTWDGWSKILDSIKPVGQKALRADVVEGANVAMDLLMQRKSANPVASILLISDSSTSDPEGVDFVIQRAEAAKVTVHSFGLGLTHKPDTMIELSTRTKASYTYVKDWMMLRECVAGCLGSLQTTSHQNVKLKLRLPEGSPAKFAKISGALQITKRASGRDAEAALGDLRFGDKRDVLVQLAIAPDHSSSEQLPQDPWETIVSGLEALGGGAEEEGQRTASVEEVPLIQADLIFGDILRDGAIAHTARPSLLTITMLPSGGRTKSMNRPPSPPIPPHPHVVQRRMELLTSDMLTRALTLVSRGQHERAHHLLRETRSILKGLGKGGLPPLPPPGSAPPRLPPIRTPTSATRSIMSDDDGKSNPNAPPKSPATDEPPKTPGSEVGNRKLPPLLIPTPTSTSTNADGTPDDPAAGIDARTMSALDAELEASLEWINHPAVFGRDSRKAVLQAIGVISSQRGYTYRTPAEQLWAERIAGVKRLAERSREWRESGEGDLGIMEEA